MGTQIRAAKKNLPAGEMRRGADEEGNEQRPPEKVGRAALKRGGKKQTYTIKKGKDKKRMKKIKKLLSLVLAMVMVLAMSGQAFATDITISGNGTYEAYKLLNATDGGVVEVGKPEHKIAYTLNDKYTSILTTATGKSTQAEIISYIGDLNTDEMRTFADDVYKKIVAAGLSADEIANNKVFEDVDQGYYLIVDTKTATGADTISLVMLDTAGMDDILVTAKEDEPTLTKEVKEVDDSTEAEGVWQAVADYDIGDAVAFKLTGTVDQYFEQYENDYYYAFHDTLATGFTLDESKIKVSIDGAEVTTGFDVITDEADLTDGCSFEIVFDNLKDTIAKSDSIITVEYEATLTAQATIGKPGNTNTAHLEYSNNPYGESKGNSVNHTVIVYTYAVEVKKTDGTNPLPGAGFTLKKYDAESGTYAPVGAEIKSTEQDPITEFTFNGLDAGEYRLEETTVPAGYNKADDVEFVIKHTFDDEENPTTLTKIDATDKNGNLLNTGAGDATFSVKVDGGVLSTTIVNVAGTKLPSTGGIGTTVFYAAGIILMAGAVFFVVRRKRA